MAKKNRAHLSLRLFAIALIAGSCAIAKPDVHPPQQAQIPNPASVHCGKMGGDLTIAKKGDGGEYGICIFEDNRQCEEWALWRGECPEDGVKITGYATPAARYCAITGGTYAVTGNSNQDDERGTCSLASGVQCDVWAYFNGACDNNE